MSFSFPLLGIYSETMSIGTVHLLLHFNRKIARTQYADFEITKTHHQLHLINDNSKNKMESIFSGNNSENESLLSSYELPCPERLAQE